MYKNNADFVNLHKKFSLNDLQMPRGLFKHRQNIAKFWCNPVHSNTKKIPKYPGLHTCV